MIALRLVVAAILGVVVGAIYHASQRKAIGESYSFFVTIILLTILVAMTTLVIGNSVARAFSLVGALSIVRFRTVVDDTRDTAFVIFAVVVGMAVGAGIVEVYVIWRSDCRVRLHLSEHGRSRFLTASTERRLEIRVDGGVDPEGTRRGSVSAAIEFLSSCGSFDGTTGSLARSSIRSSADPSGCFVAIRQGVVSTGRRSKRRVEMRLETEWPE